MKKLLISTIATSAALIALAQTQKVTVTVENEIPSVSQATTAHMPRKVALIVQNHASRGAEIPFMALTDALAAKTIRTAKISTGLREGRRCRRRPRWRLRVSSAQMAR